MKNILKLFLGLIVLTTAASCSSNLTDGTVFSLHYYEVGGLVPGDPISLSPSYRGEAPSDFTIYSISHNDILYYNPKLDGELTPESVFYVEPSTGKFIMDNTSGLSIGTYKVSLRCKSGGVEYDFPDKIIVNVIKEREE